MKTQSEGKLNLETEVDRSAGLWPGTTSILGLNAEAQRRSRPFFPRWLPNPHRVT